MRWFWWYLLAPQLFLLFGAVASLGGPEIDAAVPLCLFFILHAEIGALPLLLLAAAMGRAVVDDQGLAVQVLLLGLPVAVMLPLRRLLVERRWLWQLLIATAVALVLPELAAVLARFAGTPMLRDEPDLIAAAVAGISAPLWLWPLRRLPPFAAFGAGE